MKHKLREGEVGEKSKGYLHRPDKREGKCGVVWEAPRCVYNRETWIELHSSKNLKLGTKRNAQCNFSL